MLQPPALLANKRQNSENVNIGKKTVAQHLDPCPRPSMGMEEKQSMNGQKKRFYSYLNFDLRGNGVMTRFCQKAHHGMLLAQRATQERALL
jgi:hypothetical protein